MKRWLVIPLVLLLLQRADSQNVAVGNALPCGDENLSCVNVPTTCLTVDQVCDGDNDCSPGASIDEGGTLFARLDCIGQFGPPMMFRCTNTEVVTLDLLCDGINQCSGGPDEVGFICENKCRLPYYGDCDFTRECVTTVFGQNCGGCLPGLTENPLDVGGPCIPAVFLSLDATSYSAAEGVPTVQVCVSGSVGTGDLMDIAGQSFEVDLSLSDGTALGGVDFVWSATPAVMTLTFDSTNLLTPQCFDVLIIDDALGELEEIFTIALSLQNNSRGQVLLQTSSANISIADNDALCPDPADIVNGMVTFTGNSVGDTATYNCDPGFELIGGATTTCTQVDVNSATFQLMPPVCRPMCPDPIDIINGIVTFTGNSVGDTATYTCNLGFELIGGATRTCTQVNVNSTTFQPAVPSCRPMCPDPVDIANGMLTLTGNSVGDTATYTCDSGFELIGGATTICTQVNLNSATFQPIPPVCRPMCPNPVDIVNGMVTFTGNSVGDTTTYTCNLGFELIRGATTTCTQVDTNSAAFQPAPPSCRPLCQRLELIIIDHAMVTLTGNSVNDTATYSCDLGFELIGGVTTTCTQVDANSAAFQPEPPICRQTAVITTSLQQSSVSSGSVQPTQTPTRDPASQPNILSIVVLVVGLVSLAVALIVALVICAWCKKWKVASSKGLRQPQETVLDGMQPFEMIRNDAYTDVNPAARNIAYVVTELEGGNASLNKADTNEGSHTVYEELQETSHNQSVEDPYDYVH